MVYRLVRGCPKPDEFPELRERIDTGEIEQMNPFGRAMTTSLNNARFDPDTGEAVWVEEDYCTPPLAMEREVLGQYFDDLVVVEENVRETEGWERIEKYPPLWDEIAGEA
ncbi:hypothetical protein [Haloplanus halophilus]|uniref:hypothetical protein n=1 Tax=Haloplanus halophilus TaxID=2949993 RepID=UPI00203D11E0|nr:hypothetical protein [Haloplanus sp. GDY1]